MSWSVVWPGVKATYVPPPPVRPNKRDRTRDLPAELRAELEAAFPGSIAA